MEPVSLAAAYQEMLANKPQIISDFEVALAPGAAKIAAPVPDQVAERYDIEERDIAGSSVQILHPRANSTGIQLIYFHGGGFVLPFMPPHWTIAAGLADRTGADVWVPHYATTPEATIDDALPLLDALAVEVPQAAGANRFVVSGESAGGNLSLVFAFRANERGARRPDQLVIHAPWVDLRTQHPQSLALEPEDVLMEVAQLQRAGSAWAGSRELTDPLVSPIFGDLGALPPLTVLQGTKDLLLPDVLAFVDQSRAAGTEVELELVDGAFHVYIAIDTPQSRGSLDLAADRVRGTGSLPS